MKSNDDNIERVDISHQEIQEALRRTKEVLPKKYYTVIEKIVKAYLTVLRLLEAKKTSIRRLRRILFGAKTEKTEAVLKNAGGKGPSDHPETGNAESPAPKAGKKKAPGHGRNGAAAYQGAKKVKIAHQTLKHGDRCPGCKKGKVYKQREPGLAVRVTGQAPLSATVFELERLRCNLCGEVSTAKLPEGVGKDKYDAESGSMIGLLKYGSGLPFNRLERLEAALGVPLPASTQWDIVHDAARALEPIRTELVYRAAQGHLLHNDDTGAIILDWVGKRREKNPQEATDRTGIFTSGIVSMVKGRRIALFFTGRRHAGENLEAVLKRRARDLKAPIQMCDALSRNTSGDFHTILSNCILHARRKVVDVVDNFPDECKYILEILKDVYINDAVTRNRGMGPRKRLRYHKKHSRPLMENLKTWLEEQIQEHRIEENSGLGDAICYMINHWKPLTLFLRKAGAPLDNNICERALKKVILHRKNALFYLTENGARVGDLFMTLIYTCELNGANPFEYLTEIQKHPESAAENPEKWMPWNYREILASAARR